MKLTIIFVITILLLITFYLFRKKLHLYENLFLFLVLEFLISGYFAISYVNLETWKVSQKPDLFIIFRMVEVIILPVFVTWYFNQISVDRTLFYKCLLTILAIGLWITLEGVLTKWKVIIYQGWNELYSLFSIVVIWIITAILHKGFQYILKKEGIR